MPRVVRLSEPNQPHASPPPITAPDKFARRDSIAATLSKLTPESPDSDLLAALRQDPHLLGRAQQSAAAAYELARCCVYAPLALIGRLWNDAQRAQTIGLRSIGTIGPWALNAEEHKLVARVAMLRAALRATAEFRCILAMTAPEKHEAEKNEKHRVILAENAQLQAASASSHQNLPKWSPREFILALAQRGVALSVGSDGGILATFASTLAPADIAVLKQHKAAIAAELSNPLQVA
jgi:hypothetical protein